MGWRTLVIKEYDKITLKDNKMHISSTKLLDRKPVSYSFDEINCVVLENNYTLFSAQLMCQFIKNDVFVIFSDDCHDPKGLLLPFASHCMPLANLELQLNASEDLKQRLWTGVVFQKITNQINLMKILGCDHLQIEKCENMMKGFSKSDTTNREGLVAKLYFKALFGSGFIRFSNDTINAALNYGYKIIASALSRTLVKYGFNLYIGFHHIGKANPFNLTYDLIEPYRPLVDKWVIDNWDKLDFQNSLSYNNRLGLIDILNQFVIINDQVMSVSSSMNVLARSFISGLKYKSAIKLKLPQLIENESILKTVINNENDSDDE